MNSLKIYFIIKGFLIYLIQGRRYHQLKWMQCCCLIQTLLKQLLSACQMKNMAKRYVHSFLHCVSFLQPFFTLTNVL